MNKHSWIGLVAIAALMMGSLACACGGLGGRVQASQPTVQLLSPPANTQVAVGRQVYIQARAFGRGGIARIDFAVNGGSIGSQSPSGNQRLFAAAQPWTASAGGTYTLSATAYDADGQASAPAQVTITVQQSFAGPSGGSSGSGTTPVSGGGGESGWPEPVVDFRADRTSLQAGESTTLRWDAEYVQEVYLDGAPVVGHGTQNVSPAQTQTYVLHVVLPSGESQDYAVTIQVTGTTEQTAGPDLVVMELAVPATRENDETIPFQAEILNAGDQAANGATWRWTINDAGAGPGNWHNGGSFDLPAGERTILQGTGQPHQAGEWMVWVEVSLAGEADTTQNSRNAHFTVTGTSGQGGGADLAVGTVWCSRTQSAGQPVPFRVEVSNAGGTNAQGATWSWTVVQRGQDPGANWMMGGAFNVPAGGSTVLEGNASGLTQGNWTFLVNVSLDGETNTGNNQGSYDFSVQ
ncbi:MAG: hypothetical protein KKA73_25800 [Chloroflexi bacterium]|nr:hypothetical protein [Chloroflexota bacterium]MBU1751113.1 hypothetical protein [Chloroflexota bacterium]MBU1879461.1 hypothetical protein [Chloroflexota bacterium]